MKKFKVLFPLLAAALMLSGCSFANQTNKDESKESQESDSGEVSSSESSGEQSSSDESSSSESESNLLTEGWSEEVQEEMMAYLGELLPYIPLNEETLYSGYEDFQDYGLYYIGDDNEENLLENYGELLVQCGFEKVVDPDYGTYYQKGELYVTYDYYEATDEYAAGNEISVECPPYEATFTADDLIAAGYTPVQGWPADKVNALLQDSEVPSVTGVNLEGMWYVFEESEDTGDYLYMYTEGSFGEEMHSNLVAAGLTYYEGYGFYVSENFIVSASITETSGWTGVAFGVMKTAEIPDGDYLDPEALNLDGTSTYAEYDAVGESGAAYHFPCANGNDAIQIRSKNSNSGMVGHLEANCAAITVCFNSSTMSGRTIDIYASNDEFTIADMYGATMEKVGSLVYDAEGAVQMTYEFEADYKYIGLRSNDGACYLDYIVVTWMVY